MLAEASLPNSTAVRFSGFSSYVHCVLCTLHMYNYYNYVTLLCMQFWSVLYPSWPSLVFLLWACAIWLIPKLDPRKSVFYTSPLLVAYSFVLLLIQYVYSLDLTVEEFSRSNDIVLECSLGRLEGCKSLALLAKVSTSKKWTYIVAIFSGG